jgi:limonene 1,2-monooxygenase
MHVAETREKARENVRFGLHKWIAYFRDVAALPLVGEGDADPIDMMIESGMAVIGTPEDAIAQLERLQSQSGGFGCFLQMAHNWADWAQTQRSYELIARHVAPKFQGSNVNRDLSYERVGSTREGAMNQARAAVGASIFKHVAEKGTDNIRPEILEVMGMAKKPDAAE